MYVCKPSTYGTVTRVEGGGEPYIYDSVCLPSYDTFKPNSLHQFWSRLRFG